MSTVRSPATVTAPVAPIFCSVSVCAGPEIDATFTAPAPERIVELPVSSTELRSICVSTVRTLAAMRVSAFCVVSRPPLKFNSSIASP